MAHCERCVRVSLTILRIVAMRTGSQLLIKAIGIFMSRRDLSDAFPSDSYVPLLIASGIIVAVFGLLDLVAFMPR